jgi:hypothetical protein
MIGPQRSFSNLTQARQVGDDEADPRVKLAIENLAMPTAGAQVVW